MHCFLYANLIVALLSDSRVRALPQEAVFIPGEIPLDTEGNEVSFPYRPLQAERNFVTSSLCASDMTEECRPLLLAVLLCA